ncbi:MAG: hypothetical protein ABR543_16255 [Gemmatimonadaceae bacterium]
MVEVFGFSWASRVAQDRLLLYLQPASVPRQVLHREEPLLSSIVLRERSGTELIDAAIQLLRRHYLQLVTIMMAALLPYLAVDLFFPPTGTSMGLPMLVNLYVFILAYQLGAAAIVTAVSDSYLSGRLSPSASLGRTFSRLGRLITVSLLQGILVTLATILLIVPGMILFARTFAVQAVVVLENKGIREAFRRSAYLAGGHFWKIIGVTGLTWVISFVVHTGAILLLYLSLDFDPAVPSMLGTLASVIITALTYPLVGVVVTLLYYDMRIRKEGLDISMMMNELEPATSPAASS